MKKKPKAIPHCVGVVTIKTVAEDAPGAKRVYESRIGFAGEDVTPQWRKEIAERLKAEIKEIVLGNREAYGIKSPADVRFYASVQILACDGISGYVRRHGADT